MEAKIRALKLVIFDVDGVLTDGGLIFGNDGQEYKCFNSQDGHGIKMLRESGVEVAVITARQSTLVQDRMKQLGVVHLFQGESNKRIAYDALKQTLQLEDAQIAYVGDDLLDLPIMRQVGLAIAVENAHPIVKQYAHWVTPRAGGHGAARDVCDKVMEMQGTLDGLLQRYL
ncbi:MAG: 3-deoxy-manno-octulosonate-8-phosphatase KdsC [Candidatus Polarisedimenticolaceae bacterium]|nr:3-deoxy-manno-octulosonate-8-phosphatase KdsC [Candidatus Polarisedimenticolaceae bacterium]